MFTKSILTLSLGLFASISNTSNAQSAADLFSVPTAPERAKAGSGYLPLNNLPSLDVVEEETGRPNGEIVPAIGDAVIRADIEDQLYKSLQVRDLAVRPNHRMFVGAVMSVPFAATVKHDLKTSKASHYFKNGSIEVAGSLMIQHDGSKLVVKVSRFADSRMLQALGRKLGANRQIDLVFARGIVPAAIESYYNSDPTRIQNLLNSIDVEVVNP